MASKGKKKEEKEPGKSREGLAKLPEDLEAKRTRLTAKNVAPIDVLLLFSLFRTGFLFLSFGQVSSMFHTDRTRLSCPLLSAGPASLFQLSLLYILLD